MGYRMGIGIGNGLDIGRCPPGKRAQDDESGMALGKALRTTHYVLSTFFSSSIWICLFGHGGAES